MALAVSVGQNTAPDSISPSIVLCVHKSESPISGLKILTGEIMKTIEIDGKIFDVPDYCHYVAVDYDGKIYAYEKQPIPVNNIGGCWLPSSYNNRIPAEITGNLDRIVPDWKNRLYIFPQKEHNITPE